MICPSEKQPRPKNADAVSYESGQRIAHYGLNRWSSRDWIFALLLAASVLLAYQRVWHAGFIWDDDIYIIHNELLRDQNGLWRIWFSLDSPSQYFPLVYTAFRIEYGIWGLNPVGYHWVNLMLHAVNAVLVWRVLWRLQLPGAWVAAAVFALHPVQVESVAWITERKNVLMGLFFLLSLLRWMTFCETGSKVRGRHYALALLFYFLALSSKTTACTLPAALLFMSWLRKKTITPVLMLQIGPFLLLGMSMGLITVWWERFHQGTSGETFALGLVERLLVASHAVWFYLGKLIWPTKLIFSYPLWKIDRADPWAYGWLGAAATVAGIIWQTRHRFGPGVKVAMLFFVATLAPMLGFLMLYTFRYTFVADHYLYLAMLGPTALFAAVLGKAPKLVRNVVSTIVLLVLGALTWRQCGMYANAGTLWKTTLEQNPESWIARGNWGVELYKHGHREEAIVQYREALRIHPAYAEGHSNLGSALLEQGETGEAIAHCLKAIELNPDFAKAYFNLGNARLQQGQVESAIAEYRKALLIESAYADVHCNLGYAFFLQGRMNEAILHLDEALRLNPKHQAVHLNLGNARLRQGQMEEAIVQFRLALQTNPDFAEAYLGIGNALLQQGRVEEAIKQFREALRIDPVYALAHNSMGGALLQQGRVDEAIVHYRKAVEIAPAYANAHFNLGDSLLKKGEIVEATAQFREVSKINPGDAEAHFKLGVTLLHQGITNEAISEAQKAFSIQPNNADMQNGFAWMLATISPESFREGTKALQLATQLNESSGGNDPVILRTLAAAYAENGDFTNAAQTAEKALKLKNARSYVGLVEMLTREVRLYESRHRFESAQ